MAWQTSNPSLRGSMMSRMIKSTGSRGRLFESLVAIGGVLDRVTFVPQAVAHEQAEGLFVFHQEDTAIHRALLPILSSTNRLLRPSH